MEELIPILTIVAYFLYQGYVGYKKEQEKSAKRNLGKPNQAPARPQGQPERKREWLEELLDPRPTSTTPSFEPKKEEVQPTYQEPAYQQTYEEPKYDSGYKRMKYIPSEVPVSLLAEYKRLSTYEEDETLKKARLARNQKRITIQRLETQAHADQELEWERNQIHFDLQDAILAKAILDRPCQ